MNKKLASLLILSFISIISGCSEHPEESPWIDYVVESPMYIDMVIDHDGNVRRAIQSGPANDGEIPVKNDTFQLNANELSTLQRVMEPPNPSVYIQKSKPEEPVMLIHLDGKLHVALPTDENQIANSEAKQVRHFFKQLETRKIQ